jgi:hypothetical protein
MRCVADAQISESDIDDHRSVSHQGKSEDSCHTANVIVNIASIKTQRMRLENRGKTDAQSLKKAIRTKMHTPGED